MTTRTVKKNLAGEEDILFGEGSVIQTRNDASYNINKVRTIRPVNTIAELNDLDTEKFTKAALFEDDTVTIYQYVVSSGLWEVRPTTIVDSSVNLESLGATINTIGKHAGKQVFNTTSNKPVYATGEAAADVWVDSTGTTEHTPV